jgi:hypothetical protein
VITWNFGRDTNDGFVTEHTPVSIYPIESHILDIQHHNDEQYSLIVSRIVVNTQERGEITLAERYEEKIGHQVTPSMLGSYDDNTKTECLRRDRFIEHNGHRINIAIGELVDAAHPYAFEDSPIEHESIIHHFDDAKNYYAQYLMRTYTRFDGSSLPAVKIPLADYYAETIVTPEYIVNSPEPQENALIAWERDTDSLITDNTPLLLTGERLADFHILPQRRDRRNDKCGCCIIL